MGAYVLRTTTTDDKHGPTTLTLPKSGARKTEHKKSAPIVTAVSPVRPPSLMPAAVSTCVRERVVI